MNKSVLKDVFLHGETHADMSRLSLDSKNVVSYDNSSLYEPMLKWRAIYSNSKSGDIREILEHSKPLTREVFWSLINIMFYDACQGCENDELEALVVGDNRTYVVKMRTFTDGANIWANVYINGQLIRRMTIAE